MNSSTRCDVQNSGAVELLFYGELDAAERQRMTAHLRECRECSAAFEELGMIRTALAARPDVSAPPARDWSGFMRRLNTAIEVEAADVERASGRVMPAATLRPPSTRTRSYVGLLATAALLTIVASSVFYVARQRAADVIQNPSVAVTTPAAHGAETAIATTGLRSAGERHFERSKLVVLGLATKEAGDTPAADWAYERHLASSLLKDTRLYRQAAEERGLASLAGVMRDLEIVLLETSMAEGSDTADLGQIQRLIRKRGLIEKMDTVATVGM